MKRILALALALLASCSSAPVRVAKPAPGPLARAQAPDVFRPANPLPPEQLIEPALTLQYAILARRAGQNNPFCQVLANLDEMADPDPEDVHSVTRYAQRYYNVVVSLDPRSRVEDPNATVGAPRKIVLPQPILDAMDVERTEMYALYQRAQFTETILKQGSITQAAAKDVMVDAITRLMVSEFTEADRTVADFRVHACPERG